MILKNAILEEINYKSLQTRKSSKKIKLLYCLSSYFKVGVVQILWWYYPISIKIEVKTIADI